MRHREELRTFSFLWESRQELYDYFRTSYNLEKGAIDQAIELARKGFALRQGTAIDTRELWQKVGMGLEKKLGAKKQATAR